MMKVVEIRETLVDSTLHENIVLVNDLLKKINKELEFALEINRDDFNYMNIVLEKTKINLDKVYHVIKT